MQQLARKRARQGKPTPSWDNRPDIYQDLIPIWTSFVELHDARAYRMEPTGKGYISRPSAIRVSEISTLLEIHGIEDSETREEWYSLIRFLDREFLRGCPEDDETEEESGGVDGGTDTQTRD